MPKKEKTDIPETAAAEGSVLNPETMPATDPPLLLIDAGTDETFTGNPGADVTVTELALNEPEPPPEKKKRASRKKKAPDSERQPETIPPPDMTDQISVTPPVLAKRKTQIRIRTADILTIDSGTEIESEFPFVAAHICDKSDGARDGFKHARGYFRPRTAVYNAQHVRPFL